MADPKPMDGSLDPAGKLERVVVELPPEIHSCGQRAVTRLAYLLPDCEWVLEASRIVGIVPGGLSAAEVQREAAFAVYNDYMSARFDERRNLVLATLFTK